MVQEVLSTDGVLVKNVLMRFCNCCPRTTAHHSESPPVVA